MNYATGAVGALLMILMLVFAFQNWASVDVSFLAWSLSLPKVFLILGTYLFGMFSGWGLFHLVRRLV